MNMGMDTAMDTAMNTVGQGAAMLTATAIAMSGQRRVLRSALAFAALCTAGGDPSTSNGEQRLRRCPC
jgi:hypothetical protein